MRMMRMLLVLALFLPFACQQNDQSDGQGNATVVITDAATDDLDVFEVDVTNIVFHKLSGADVSVMNKSARVDLASLEDFGELIAGVGLEIGFYTGLTMTIDFSNADVYLKDNTAPAALLDGDGNPLTGSMDVTIDFHSGDRPFVWPGRNHLFQLDFDLNEAVSTDTGANTVTFTPIINAVVDPTNPKPIIATGYITSVDMTTSSFTVEKRAPDSSVIGQFKVAIAVSTNYQIDGTIHTGIAGLTAMQSLAGTDTRVFVRGVVDSWTRILRASVVETGAGTFGNGQDWVEGLITAVDNSGTPVHLTVLGQSKQYSTGTRTFNTSHTVDVSNLTTHVLRRGTTDNLTVNALNVGQRVIAFGSLSGTGLDATGSTGVVRMIRTGVYGYAVSPPAGNVLTLDMRRIGLRDQSRFNFTVGGVTEADPATFTVNVTGLDTSGITTGSRIRALGWCNPVGIPGDQNFSAISIVNRNVDARLLFCTWLTPTTTAIASASATQVDLNVTGALIKVVDDGFAGKITLNDTPAPVITPKYSVGIYCIVENQGVQVHLNFDAFTTSLNDRIAPASAVKTVSAVGSFDDVTQEFNASIVTVVLK